MSKRDYYEILGVQKGVSKEDIKKAYKKTSKKISPRYFKRRKCSRKV